MGLVNAETILSNPKDKNIKPIVSNSLVDTGALHLCIPEHIAIQLELEELYKREVTTADGKKHLVPYVGPLSIKFEKSRLFYWSINFRGRSALGGCSNGRHGFTRINS